MALYITQLEKHKFVCGLFWQALSRPRELEKEARDLAKRIDADLMLLRVDQGTAQAGFAHSRDGARRALFSLAAVVSKTLAMEGVYYDGQQQPAHNWLGAFKLPDGKWAYFAVRDASFLPNGDFAGTKEEVLERLQGDYGLGGWNAVIGDEELAPYGFHNFNARKIETLIPRKKDGTIKTARWWALRRADTRTKWRPLVIGGTLILIAAAGLAYWQHYEREQEQLRRDRAIEAARQKLLGNGGLADASRPWASKPLPLPTVQTCVEHLTHLTPGGWALDAYVCTPGQASYAWSRQDSTVGFLLAQVPKATIDLNGEKATHVDRLAAAPVKDEALLELNDLLEPVLSRLQLMKLAPRLTKAPSYEPAAAAGNQAPRPGWQALTFSLSARGVEPIEIATILNRPGIRVDKLTYRGGEWSFEGVMYAK
ncbi:MAG: pilus assembly protein [Burkholderia sp.]|nr:pilus assembly protein [Burkholderia sp.]